MSVLSQTLNPFSIIFEMDSLEECISMIQPSFQPLSTAFSKEKKALDIASEVKESAEKIITSSKNCFRRLEELIALNRRKEALDLASSIQPTIKPSTLVQGLTVDFYKLTVNDSSSLKKSRSFMRRASDTKKNLRRIAFLANTYLCNVKYLVTLPMLWSTEGLHERLPLSSEVNFLKQVDSYAKKALRGFHHIDSVISLGNSNTTLRKEVIGREVLVKKTNSTPSNNIWRKSYNEAYLALINQSEFVLTPRMFCKNGAYFKFMPQGDLYTFLVNEQSRKNQKEISERFCFSILECIAQALASLHSNNIIHRDLKPENILIESESRVKLCDFGLSTTTSLAEKEHFPLCGTIFYMPPETALQHRYTTSFDIWSYGVLIHLILFKSLPFDSQLLSNYRKFKIFLEKLEKRNVSYATISEWIEKGKDFLSKNQTERTTSQIEKLEQIPQKDASQMTSQEIYFLQNCLKSIIRREMLEWTKSRLTDRQFLSDWLKKMVRKNQLRYNRLDPDGTLLYLLKQCFSKDPTKRPKAKTILETLNQSALARKFQQLHLEKNSD